MPRAALHPNVVHLLGGCLTPLHRGGGAHGEHDEVGGWVWLYCSQARHAPPCTVMHRPPPALPPSPCSAVVQREGRVQLQGPCLPATDVDLSPAALADTSNIKGKALKYLQPCLRAAVTAEVLGALKAGRSAGPAFRQFRATLLG
jgi:hypothetical protein